MDKAMLKVKNTSNAIAGNGKIIMASNMTIINGPAIDFPVLLSPTLDNAKPAIRLSQRNFDYADLRHRVPADCWVHSGICRLAD